MGVTVNLEIRGVEVRPEPPHGRIKGPHSAPAFKAIPRPWGGHLPHYDGPFQPSFPKGDSPSLFPVTVPPRKGDPQVVKSKRRSP